MPDALTPAEREAIARYTGPVQIIPRGVSGIPPEEYGKGLDWRKHRWDASAATNTAKPEKRLMTPDEISANMKAALARKRQAARPGIPEMIQRDGETRKETISRLIAEGRTHREVAAFIGITHQAVFQNLKRAS